MSHGLECLTIADQSRSPPPALLTSTGLIRGAVLPKAAESLIDSGATAGTAGFELLIKSPMRHVAAETAATTIKSPRAMRLGTGTRKRGRLMVGESTTSSIYLQLTLNSRAYATSGL